MNKNIRNSCVKAGFAFSREHATILITLYERHPILYEVNDENYKNRNKRQAALQIIKTEFEEHFDVIISVDDIKKKINSLRTQFFGECNKVSKSFVSGCSADHIYTPSLWCYDQLQFLKNTNPVREGESTLHAQPEPEVEPEEAEIVFDGTVNELNSRDGSELDNLWGNSSRTSTSTRPPTRQSVTPDDLHGNRKRARTNSVRDSKVLDFMERATNVFESTTAEPQEKDPNPLEAFGLVVAAELKEIKNPRTCRRLRREILDLIHEAIEKQDNEENDRQSDQNYVTNQ